MLIPLVLATRESLSRTNLPTPALPAPPVSYQQAASQYLPIVQAQLRQAEANMMQQAANLARQGWLGSVPTNVVAQEALRPLQNVAAGITATAANQTANDSLNQYMRNMGNYANLASRRAGLMEEARANRLREVTNALNTAIEGFFRSERGVYPLGLGPTGKMVDIWADEFDRAVKQGIVPTRPGLTSR